MQYITQSAALQSRLASKVAAAQKKVLSAPAAVPWLTGMPHPMEWNQDQATRRSVTGHRGHKVSLWCSGMQEQHKQ